ncbi:MAG TPA: hypothetical protein VNZ57_14630 [Longimicrobiales bacterium]|nr:hypothetical protein [Longimicrobiales bacterium]
MTQWGREHGREAWIEWHPILDCPVIHFRRRDSDPMLREHQEGRAPETTESVMLHWYDKEARRFRPLDLGQMGAGGIREMLDRANLWSGRGEYRDMQAAIEAAIRRQGEHREALRRKAEQAGRKIGWLLRRHLLDLPHVLVTSDVARNNNMGEANGHEPQRAEQAHQPQHDAAGRGGDRRDAPAQ